MTSSILQFANSAAPADIYDDAAYLALATRTSGVQPGIADPLLYNKTLKQVSLISAGIAKYIADNQANNITDALTVQNIADYFATVISAGVASVQGAYKNLRVNSIGINNYNSVITIDSIVLKNNSGSNYLATAVNKTISANGTVGAPLSIMSARAASTWYYRWLWYNAVNGLTATLDISSTAPTAPTGYSSTDYKVLLPGADRTDASGSTYLSQIITRGKKTRYVTLAGSNLTKLPTMVSGVQGSQPSTLVSVATGNFIPPTANSITFLAADTASTGLLLVAPNNSYSYAGSIGLSGNPAPYQANPSVGNVAIQGEIVLETTNIYVIFSTASSVLNCLGWEDNV